MEKGISHLCEDNPKRKNVIPPLNESPPNIPTFPVVPVEQPIPVSDVPTDVDLYEIADLSPELKDVLVRLFLGSDAKSEETPILTVNEVFHNCDFV